MQRKVFELIASAGGAVMVLVLLVAGGLLMWGYSFTTTNVHNQLAQQDIVFPTKAEFAKPRPVRRSPRACCPISKSTPDNP